MVDRVCSPTTTVTGVPSGWSLVPAIAGVRSFVARVAPPSMVTCGAVVSTVSTCVASPTFREGSEIEAVTTWSPASSVLVPTRQRPPSPTVVVTVWSATVTVTGAPAGSSVVPEIGGDASLVDRTGPPSMVTSGAVRSSFVIANGLSARPTVLEVSTRPLTVAPAPTPTAPAVR